MANHEEQFKKLVSHAKEYGFIFPSSEIYDGLAAVYDYGEYGSELKKNIRDYEYEVILALGFEALAYDNTVLINAPFSREVRDAAYMKGLRDKLAAQGAKLVVIWIVTDPEVCHQRMIKRNSDRDTWKHSSYNQQSFRKQDAWKAQLILAYTF